MNIVDFLAGFRNSLKDHRWLPIFILRVKITDVVYMKRILKELSEFVSNFLEARTFFIFFLNKSLEHCKNHQRIYRK
jgi:hypothetical protein